MLHLNVDLFGFNKYCKYMQIITLDCLHTFNKLFFCTIFTYLLIIMYSNTVHDFHIIIHKEDRAHHKNPSECTVSFRHHNCLPNKIVHTNLHLHTVRNNRANRPHNHSGNSYHTQIMTLVRKTKYYRLT